MRAVFEAAFREYGMPEAICTGNGSPCRLCGVRVAAAGDVVDQHDVHLSPVLWGERTGLVAADDRWFTIDFAQVPIARFDRRRLCVVPLP